MSGEKNTEKNSEFQMGTQSVCLVFFFYMSLFISFFGYSRQYRHLKYLVEKSLLFVRVAIIFTPKTCMCLKCEISTGLHEGGGRTGGRFCQNQNILGA